MPRILYDPDSSTCFRGDHALGPSIPLLIQTNLLEVSPEHSILSHNSMNAEGLISTIMWSSASLLLLILKTQIQCNLLFAVIPACFS